MNVLNRIDDYFSERSIKEFFYTLLMIVLVIGFLIYYFIYPVAQKYENGQRKKYENLSSELNSLRVNLNVYNARVAVLSKQIKEKKNTLLTLQKKKLFYAELVKLLDFAEFDQYKWANIVQSAVMDAKEKGLAVNSITNKIYDVNISTGNNMPEIVKRMDIGVSLKGKYQNFIYYIYGYENKKELIRVKEMNITSPDSYFVTFSIYGYYK